VRNASSPYDDEGQPITRTCLDCTLPFTLTVKEQRFYEARALDLPKRCSACRRVRKLEKARYGAEHTA
jgi:hypothetical protein